MRRLHGDAPSDRAAPVRAVRCSDGVAGASLWRMRRSPARLRACSGGAGVRRPASSGRGRLEGAWPPQACGLGCGGRPESMPRPVAACVVFVPGDPDRRLKRGHHAAERLANELAREWELPLRPLLTRARGSPRQRGLTQHERRRNVAGAFLAHGRVPTRVVLIDDVYTTGATANAAASALRKGGASTVEIVTLARTIRIR